MSRRGTSSHYYSYHSPAGGHGSSGEEGFRSPRPQYQSSPRPYGRPKAFINHQNHGGYHHHSNMSPIPHLSPGAADMNQMNHNRSFSKGSPTHNQSSNFHGHRGRGRGGRYHSGGYNSNRSDSNPGGSDNIREYFHPSMLEDPWANLTPVPISETLQSAANA